VGIAAAVASEGTVAAGAAADFVETASEGTGLVSRAANASSTVTAIKGTATRVTGLDRTESEPMLLTAETSIVLTYPTIASPRRSRA
jgi:hypothetical protein